MVGQYTGAKDKIDVLCNDCNVIFPIAPSHLLEGHGCPHCNKSLGENRIKNYLQNNDVYFETQYRIEGCKGIKKPLPFDFAVFEDKDRTKLKYLIEYQGEQHFKPVQFRNMTIEEAEDQFKIQQINDRLKRGFCTKNNIKLLEIPYWDFNNIESILNDFDKLIKAS